MMRALLSVGRVLHSVGPALLVAALAGFSLALSAQIRDLDPDWKELDAPAPPPLATAQWMEFPMPGSQLRFALDARSISIGSDGVVRYVLSARGTGQAVNARYEAVRCATGQVRVLARHDSQAGWVPLRESEWTEISGRSQYRATSQLARAGLCNGRGTPRSAAEALQALQSFDRY